MKIKTHRLFEKNFKKRILTNPKLTKTFKSRINLFQKDKQAPLLRDHQLTGNLKNFRSFSITGDIRVIYQVNQQTVILVDIGSHNQLYN